MDRRLSNNEGFTLMEIIMALAILGISLFVLLETQFSSLSLFSNSQEVTLQNMLMDQAIVEAEIELLTGEEKGEGDFGDDFPEYSFSYESELVDENELPGLIEVKVTLYYNTFEEEVIFRVYDGRQENAA
jgi:general secretion pathway protein I